MPEQPEEKVSKVRTLIGLLIIVLIVVLVIVLVSQVCIDAGKQEPTPGLMRDPPPMPRRLPPPLGSIRSENRPSMKVWRRNDGRKPI